MYKLGPAAKSVRSPVVYNTTIHQTKVFHCLTRLFECEGLDVSITLIVQSSNLSWYNQSERTCDMIYSTLLRTLGTKFFSLFSISIFVDLLPISNFSPFRLFLFWFCQYFDSSFIDQTCRKPVALHELMKYGFKTFFWHCFSSFESFQFKTLV